MNLIEDGYEGSKRVKLYIVTRLKCKYSLLFIFHSLTLRLVKLRLTRSWNSWVRVPTPPFSRVKASKYLRLHKKIHSKDCIDIFLDQGLHENNL